MRREASDRAARVTAGSLLIAERKTHREIKQAIDASIAEAALEANRRSDKSKAAILAALLLVSRAMADKAAKAIREGRQAARTRSQERLRVEMDAAGVRLGGMHLRHVAAGIHDDVAHAQLAAESLATQWRGIAAYDALTAARKDDDVSVAIEVTSYRMNARITRTAATETAQAFNDERHKAMTDALKFDPDLAGQISEARIVRVWDAILDRRTCETCSALDGAIADLDGTFRGGFEPGFVHPLCRCIWTPRAMPALARAA